MACVLSLTLGCPIRFNVDDCQERGCPTGETCGADGLCALTSGVDGEHLRDGGPTDAGTLGDGGGTPLDAAVPDGGPEPSDAAVPDGGPEPLDASVPDAGTPCIDLDSDSFGLGCENGPDCNDQDRNVFQSVAIFIDADNDGVGSGESARQDCVGLTVPPYYSLLDTDCDDQDGSKFRTVLVFPDFDGDGKAAQVATPVCVGATLPTGFLEVPPTDGERDCDDTDARRGFGNPEVCNGLDDNCDGFIDEDACEDGNHQRVVDSGKSYLLSTTARNYLTHEPIVQIAATSWPRCARIESGSSFLL